MTPEDLLAAIQCCWCATLEGSLGGAPATCCVTAGAPSIPDCCAGYAWVRLVDAYPSVAFPQVQTQPQRCIIDTWAIQVEVGIQRCAPQPCDTLGNVCCDAEKDAAAILLDDWRQIRKLFTCGCIGLSSDQIIMGKMTVYGPQGGCNGVSMKATLRASD